MQDQLFQALKAHDVEYADIRIEDVTNSWVKFRGPDLDTIGSSRTVGGVVRALYKGGWGYATFNDLSELDKRVREACETARLVGTEQTFFAPVEPVVADVPAKMEKDFRQVPLADKKALAEEYNRLLLGHHPKIQTSDRALWRQLQDRLVRQQSGQLHQRREAGHLHVPAGSRPPG